MSLRRAVVALCLGTSISSVLAGTGGSFADGGNTLVSALLMFLGNDEAVYILDKAEGNSAQIAGHPAWGARWDIQSHQAIAMDIKTNSFCSSGMHLPNGSFVSFGGNDGITVGGKVGSQRNPDGTGMWDSVYQDFDGRKSIRILNPCGSADNLNSANCNWYDEPTVLSMKKNRWYAAVEPTGDGTVVILGGFVSGGYINRWFPDVDPVTEKGLAENTYEFYPARAGDAQIVQFLVKTSGLNAYAHTYLMPSGKMLVQANHSTMLWDYNTNTEFPLPDMPNGVIRVYPASGGVAMLPLTPANNYTPTVLFCGGSNMPDDNWGSYAGPNVDPWLFPASADCQRLTPEPADGTAGAYTQDDNMLEGRTMGQFVNLPDGTLLMINGGLNGTAGYATSTQDTPESQMPFGPSLASGPVFTPAIYNPKAARGSRWSNEGMDASTIPRLYHSSAILLPDASVLVAGSNPNPDVNLTTMFKTEYRAEVFYPPYFSASVRPVPSGMPKTLGYGGKWFDVNVPASSYLMDSANGAAEATVVVLVRGGYTTHAMNMGQRMIQLNNTYTVAKNGTITLHVSPLPPNPNLFQPGPALLFVVVNGVPSNGTFVIVGSGSIGVQPTAEVVVLPESVVLSASGGEDPSGGSGSSSSSSGSGSKMSLGLLVGAIAAGVALLAVCAVGAVLFVRRRKAKASASAPSKAYAMGRVGGTVNTTSSTGSSSSPWTTSHDTDSSVFVPLAHGRSTSAYADDDTWDPRTASSVQLNAPYRDFERTRGSMGSFGSGSGNGNGSQVFGEYDPYSGLPAQQEAGAHSYAYTGDFGHTRGGAGGAAGGYGSLGGYDADSMVSRSRPGSGYSTPQQQRRS